MEEESKPSTLRLSDAERDSYIEALEAAGATQPCARCGSNGEFGILPAKSPMHLFLMSEAVVGVQEQYMEAIVTMCFKCGALYNHSAAFLDRIVDRQLSKDDGDDDAE